ncbi:MAG: tetraacyldisaccharide 4'-kinase [Bacillota bacterium]
MRKQLEKYLLNVIKGEKDRFFDKIVKIILTILEAVYLVIIKIRDIFYKIGIFKSKKLDTKTISVGNITTGGTGKTPVVEKLASELSAKDKKVGILSRGYHSEGDTPLVISDGQEILTELSKAGDELYMMASHLSGIPIVKGKDRHKAGELAISEFDLDMLIVDDSFQHLQLDRDLDIVVIDALNPFGYDHLLPRGILREPLSSLKRSDIVIVSRTDQVNESKLEDIKNTIYSHNSEADIFTSNHCPVKLKSLASNNENDGKNISDLKGKKVLALSGIGNPDSFVKSLEELDIKVVETAIYPDHYDYDQDDVMDIMMKAQLNGVDFIITTEKDSVKFNEEILNNFSKMDTDLYSLGIELKFNNEVDFSGQVLKFL